MTFRYKITLVFQNNLVVHVNGRRVSLSKGIDKSDVSERIRSTLYRLNLRSGSMDAKLANIATQIFQRERKPYSARVNRQRFLPFQGLLKTLLELQKLDAFDIEGIFPIYLSLLHDTESGSSSCQQDLKQNTFLENSFVQSVPNGDALTEGSTEIEIYEKEHQKLLDLSKEQKKELLRNWVIATTAKDCSIYTTFQIIRRSHCCIPDLQNVDLLEFKSSEFALIYKVSVGDLDLKSLSKIPSQFKRDQAAVENANRLKESV